MSTSAAAASPPTRHSANPVVDGEVVCFHGERARRLVSHTVSNPDRVFYRCTREDKATRCKFWAWRDTLPAPVGSLRDEQGQGQQQQAQQVPSVPQSPAQPLPPPPTQAPAQVQRSRFAPASRHPQAPASTSPERAGSSAAAASTSHQQNQSSNQNQNQNQNQGRTLPPPPRPKTSLRARPSPIATRTATAPTQDEPGPAPKPEPEPEQDSGMQPPPPPTQPSSPVRPRGLSNAHQSQSQAQAHAQAQAQNQSQSQSQTQSASASGSGSFFGLPITPAVSEAALPLHEAQSVPPPTQPQPQTRTQVPGSGSRAGPNARARDDYVVIEVPSSSTSGSGGNAIYPNHDPGYNASGAYHNPHLNSSGNNNANAGSTTASTVTPNAPVTPVAQRTLARAGGSHLRTPEGRAMRLAAMQRAQEEEEAKKRAASAGGGSGPGANASTAAAPAFSGSEAVSFGQAGPVLAPANVYANTSTNAGVNGDANANVNADAGAAARFKPPQAAPAPSTPQRNRSPTKPTNQANQPPGPGLMRTSPQKRPRSPRQEHANQFDLPNGPTSNDDPAPADTGAAPSTSNPVPAAVPNNSSSSNSNRNRGLLFFDEPTIFDDAPPGPSPPVFQPKPRAPGHAQAHGRPATAPMDVEPQTQASDPHSHTLSQTLTQSTAPDLDAILGPASRDASPDADLDLDPESLGFSAGAENERDEAEAELVTLYPPPTPEHGQGQRAGFGLYPRLSQVESPGYRPAHAQPQHRELDQDLAGHETSYETTAEGYETAPLDADVDADGEDSPRRPPRALRGRGLGFALPENAALLNKSPTKRRRLANGEDADGSGGGLMTPPDTGHRSSGARARTRGGPNVNGPNAGAGPSRLREEQQESGDEGWPMEVESPSGARGAKKASGARNKGKGKERERRANANAMEREMSVDPEWDGYPEDDGGKIPAPLFHPSPTPEPAALFNGTSDATASSDAADTGARILSALRTLQSLDASGYLDKLERKMRASQSSMNARTSRNTTLESENADLRAAVADLEARVAELTREIEGLRSVVVRIDEGAMDVEEGRPQGTPRRVTEEDKEEIRLMRERIARLERRFEGAVGEDAA